MWIWIEHLLGKQGDHSCTGKSGPAAHGVIFKDASGSKHRAYLSKEKGKRPMGEIIVSAGALGSPQLLMLSGIGPAQHLKSMGIKVLLDQPMVGQGMSDNPMNFVFVPSPSPVEVSLVQVVGITRFGTYIEAISGIDFTGYFGISSSLQVLTHFLTFRASLCLSNLVYA